MRQNLKVLYKRLWAAVAASCIVVGMMPGSTEAAREGEMAMGRYLESDVELPEGFSIKDIVRTNEGTLRIAGQTEEGVAAMFDSSDGGDTWEQSGALPDEYNDVYFVNMVLNPMGGGAAIMLESNEKEEASGSSGEPDVTYYFVSFDADGKAKKTFKGSDFGGFLQYTQSGELLFRSYGSGVDILDQDTGEKTMDVADVNADNMGVCGNEALLLLPGEVQRYDISTGEPLPRDEALDDALYADAASYIDVTSVGSSIVMAGDQEGRLHYATNNGIFSHIMGGSAVEHVVDGNLCSLGDPGIYFVSLAVLDQSFYVAVATGEESKLLRFTYDAEVPSMPERELTVYSLKENDAIRQSAVLYQKANPDVYVNYRIGMSGSDGVTASDALRTLNTDILAGNGPDILILDEMSVDTYARQGILTDLSDVVSEISKSEGILENIIDAYRTDGGLPAVPARFGIMMVAGEPELIHSIDGFDSLAGLAAQNDVLHSYDVVNLGEILYRNCAGSWKNKDNTIDGEKLAEFIRGIKQISDTYREKASDKAQEELSMYDEGLYATWGTLETYGVSGDDMGMGIIELAQGTCKIKLGTLNDITDYSGLTSINAEMGACQQALLKVQQSGVFVPTCVLSVLNTAKEGDCARDFVKYMLSQEGQSQSQGRGFPVNVKSFEAELYTDQYSGGNNYSMSVGDNSGDYFEFTYTWPTTEESDALYELAKQLTVSADLERVQHDVVMEELNRCLSGEISEDEAIDAIMQKLNLYLAE